MPTKINIKEGQRVGRFNVKYLRFTEVKNGHRYGMFECCECGNEFESRISHVNASKIAACKGCRGKLHSGTRNSKFTDITNKRVGKLVVKRLAPEKHEKGSRRLIWECKCDCGNIVYKPTYFLTTGLVNSCGNCKFRSNGEFKISNILDELGIEYLREKEFETCRDVGRLRFDFWLPQQKICIEYQGKQHYRVNPYGSWSTSEHIKGVQKRDNIKRNWCKENNVNLIEIPYWELNNINKDFIKDLIFVK